MRFKTVKKSRESPVFFFFFNHVFERVEKSVISVGKRPNRANRCVLRQWKSRERVPFFFLYQVSIFQRLHLYSSKGCKVLNSRFVRGVPFVNKRYTKGVPFPSKWCKGLDLGAEPPRIKRFWVYNAKNEWYISYYLFKMQKKNKKGTYLLISCSVTKLVLQFSSVFFHPPCKVFVSLLYGCGPLSNAVSMVTRLGDQRLGLM